MKHLNLKLTVIMVTTSLLYLGCQKDTTDDIIKVQDEIQGTEISYLSVADIPEVVDNITIYTGKASLSNKQYTKGIGYKKAFINVNNILKVKSKDTIANYSFSITIEQSPINEFYNLVVSKDAKGNLKKPYIIKYVVDDDALDIFLDNNKNFKYFKGKQILIPFNKFFNSIDILGKSSSLSNDCSDTETIINNSNYGSDGDFFDIPPTHVLQTNPYAYDYGTGSGAYLLYLNTYDTDTGQSTSYGASVRDTQASVNLLSSQGITQFTINNTPSSVYMTGYVIETSGPMGGGASSGCSTTIRTHWSDGTGTISQFYFNCGGPLDHQYKTTNTKASSECVTSEGEVGVNTSDLNTSILNRLGLSGRSSEGLWLNVYATIPQILSIDNFLTANSDEQGNASEEAIAFGKSAVEALMDGGEVDFEDNVILSKEFKDNSKLKCVYDKLAGDNNTLFKDTVGAFVDNPNINLLFTIGDCGAAAGCTQNQYVEETGIITIKISNITEAPIQIAQTIIHEAIHAELAKYVLEHDSTVDTNNKPRLFELYKYYRESGVPEQHIDHPYMAINYINPIASALRQFDNNRYPIDYYKSLAWVGLEDFDVNAVLTDPLVNTYSQYLSTIIQNSTVCN